MLRIPGFIVVVGCLLIPAGSVAVPAAVPPARPSVVELLDRYAKHDFEAPVLLAHASKKDAEALVEELSQRGGAWISARGSRETPGRRLIAATFALDVVRIWSRSQADPGGRWTFGRRMLAWGCEQLRRNATPLDGELWWHLAAIGLFENYQDVSSLIGDEVPPDPLRRMESVEGPRGHLAHALARFPTDPRLRLAHIVSKEISTYGLGGWNAPNRSLQPRIGALPPEITAEFIATLTEQAKPRQGPRDPLASLSSRQAAVNLARVETLRSTPREYEELFSVEAVAAEAHLRSGVSSFRLGQRSDALAQLVRAETLATDPVLLYLIRVYTGCVYEATGQPEQAIAAYRRALDVAPIAPTASLVLVSALMQESRVEDAYDVADRLLSNPRAVDRIACYRTAEFCSVMDYFDRLKRVLP